jgi:hypothetical protein
LFTDVTVIVVLLGTEVIIVAPVSIAVAVDCFGFASFVGFKVH